MKTKNIRVLKVFRGGLKLVCTCKTLREAQYVKNVLEGRKMQIVLD